jgi:hypothetical protein
MTDLAPHLSAYLRERLPLERQASPHTCDTYAYAFRLLVTFAAQRLHTTPSALAIEQLDAPLILAFLEHLETVRHNRPKSRNARLAAIKAFAHFVEYRVPSSLEQIRRILAIPFKKTDEPLVCCLDRVEVQALLDAPDPALAAAFVIGRCCIWHSLPDCVSRNWSGCPWTTWTCGPSRRCTSWAKAGANGFCHSGRIPPMRCEPGTRYAVQLDVRHSS